MKSSMGLSFLALSNSTECSLPRWKHCGAGRGRFGRRDRRVRQQLVPAVRGTSATPLARASTVRFESTRREWTVSRLVTVVFVAGLATILWGWTVVRLATLVWGWTVTGWMPARGTTAAFRWSVTGFTFTAGGAANWGATRSADTRLPFLGGSHVWSLRSRRFLCIFLWHYFHW